MVRVFGKYLWHCPLRKKLRRTFRKVFDLPDRKPWRTRYTARQYTTAPEILDMADHVVIYIGSEREKVVLTRPRIPF